MRNFKWKNMTLPRRQRHKRDLRPQEAIYPANGSPGAEPRPGTMGTVVKNRGCTAGCHGNVAASSTGCQRVSVHQLFLFLEPWFHQSFLAFPHIQQMCTVKVHKATFFKCKNKCVFSAWIRKEQQWGVSQPLWLKFSRFNWELKSGLNNYTTRWNDKHRDVS